MSRKMQALFAVLGVAILAVLVVLTVELRKAGREPDEPAQQEQQEQQLAAEELEKSNAEAADKIKRLDEESRRAAIENALQLSDAEIEEIEASGEMKQAAEARGAKLDTIYRVNGGRYALVVSTSGSQGPVVMVVGVDESCCIAGISVLSHSETSGIGTKVIHNESTVSGKGALDQYRGKSAAELPVELGEDVDVVSGATYTSEAIKDGVNAALAVYELLG